MIGGSDSESSSKSICPRPIARPQGARLGPAARALSCVPEFWARRCSRCTGTKGGICLQARSRHVRRESTGADGASVLKACVPSSMGPWSSASVSDRLPGKFHGTDGLLHCIPAPIVCSGTNGPASSGAPGRSVASLALVKASKRR
jgi:hypothetical protein